MSFRFDRTKFRHPRVLVIALLALLLTAPAASARTVLKMATLVPDGSVWDTILKDMGAQWQESTDGEVALRLYAGGVAGDEPDVVRKMRIGQLHGAVLTVAGLSQIEKGFEIFEIPMFFESYDELFHVLEALRPQLEKRLEAQGYILLNYGQGGWVHFFSKKPIRTVDDLRAQKLFVWAGSPTVDLWKENGFQPVPLAATDILTGLQTGMIEVIPSTPLAALSFQWFRQTPNMQGLGLAPLIGGTVITKRAWSRLSPEVQTQLRKVNRETEKRLNDEIPDQDRRAVEAMKERGLEVVEVPEEVAAKWRKEAETFIDFKRERMEAKDLLDLARTERDAFRAKKAKSGS
jgi:TRAP-type C4-dicarboxylate transport system substrate-binding protein